MRKNSKSELIDRIIDANINRVKEGLRVCEEVTRFILNNRSLTQRFKKTRHHIDLAIKLLPKGAGFIQKRNTTRDVGKNIYANELKRKGIPGIFSANVQRVKESIRVLEEFSKLKNIDAAIKFKKVRYDIYELEKKAAQKISSLCNYR